MTDELRACQSCQQLVTPGTTECPSCKARIDWHELWPTWHGAPTTTTDPDIAWKVVETSPSGEDFEVLALDPSLVDVQISRPGKRWWVVATLLCAIAWFLVNRLYHDGNPAQFWDIIWYGLAIVTLGLSITLLVAFVGRARTHGLGPALTWLVS